MAKRTREIDGVQRRYTWRLYPTEEQDAALRRQATMCADLWNVLLELCETIREFRVWAMAPEGPCFLGLDGAWRQVTIADVFERRAWLGTRRWRVKEIMFYRPPTCRNDSRTKPRTALPSEMDMGYWITDMREICPEWAALSTWTPRRVATSLAASWAAFFRRMRELSDPAVYAARSADFIARHGRKPTRMELAGYPRYKSRNALAVPHRAVSGCTIKGTGKHWTVKLKGVPDVGWRNPAYGLPEGIRAIHDGGLPSHLHEWTDVDFRHYDGHWHMSAASVLAPRRGPGDRPVHVKFDLFDGFAMVDNTLETPPELLRAAEIERECDERTRAFDERWPRGAHLSDAEREEMTEARRGIAAARSHAASIRRNALHVWTARLIARASALTIVAPASVRSATSSARGSPRNPGAAVADVAALNRHVLGFAPATAIAMLKYKAAEAGIPCRIVEDREAKAPAVSKALQRAVKAVRKRSRQVAKIADGLAP